MILFIHECERTIVMRFLVYWFFYLFLEKEYSSKEFALDD